MVWGRDLFLFFSIWMHSCPHCLSLNCPFSTAPHLYHKSSVISAWVRFWALFFSMGPLVYPYTPVLTSIPFFFFKDLFINWLIAMLGLCFCARLSLVVASGGHSSSQCTGLPLSWPLLLRSTGSRRAGSAVVAHRPSRSAACGIFPDQGSNPCPLH